MTDETQVETPIEDAPGLPESDSSTEIVETPKADDASPETPRDEDGKFLSANAQKRIDALTREKYDREREAQYWREQALRNEPKPEPPKAPEPVKLPTLEEVGYDEAKYQAALIEYATKHAEEVVTRRLTEAEQKRTEQTRAGKFLERVQEVAKANPDFDPNEIFQRQFYPVSETMREIMLDSDSGADLLHWVHTNQDQAAKIANLPPHLAAKEMGRIEAILEQRKASPPPRPTVSKAPPPPPRVEDAETTMTGVKPSDAESDKLSDAEWRRMREKELKRKKV